MGIIVYEGALGRLPDRVDRSFLSILVTQLGSLLRPSFSPIVFEGIVTSVPARLLALANC